MARESKAKVGTQGKAGAPGGGGLTHTPIAEPTSAQLCMKLGAVLELMRLSPVHRNMFIADVDWAILPPTLLGQTRLYHDDSKPIAYVCWAFLDAETEARVKAGQIRLRPIDWKSGDRPWIMEAILPYGGFDKILEDLTRTVFGGVRPKVVGERG